MPPVIGQKEVMSTPIPVALIERAKSDRNAMDELIAQYRGFVASLVRPRCIDLASTEDVCQEVWVIVEKELPKLRESKAFLGWLARVTENATTAYLKRHAREKDVRKQYQERREFDGPTAEEPAEAAALMDERNYAVIRALQALPEDYRIPVTMRFYQGMTAREIADVLDAPLGTILSRLFRANAMLKERLKRYLDEE